LAQFISDDPPDRDFSFKRGYLFIPEFETCFLYSINILFSKMPPFDLFASAGVQGWLKVFEGGRFAACAPPKEIGGGMANGHGVLFFGHPFGRKKIFIAV